MILFIGDQNGEEKNCTYDNCRFCRVFNHNWSKLCLLVLETVAANQQEPTLYQIISI